MALGCAAALTAGATAASAASAPSNGGPPLLPDQVRQLPGQVALHPLVRSGAAAVSTSVTTWTKTVNDGGTSFTYRMVGKDPTVAQATPSTTISTELVPVIIRFSNGDVWNPTVGDSCD